MAKTYDNTEPLVIEGGKKRFHKNLSASTPVPEAAIQKVVEILKSGELFRYGCNAPIESEAALLERDFAHYIGTKYALAVNSCSSALFISLLSAGLQPGDKVLVPGFTFTAVPSSITHAGGQPVLVECNSNYTINLKDLRRKMSCGAKYIVLSHMRGHISDMDTVITLCRKNNICLIEDAAHSLGAKYNDQPIGTFGLTGCFSFQSHKMINAGEGGMLITNDDEIIAKAILYSGSYEKSYKKHFIGSNIISQFEKKIPSYNLRISNVTAAIARAQIPLIDDNGRKYNKNYKILYNIIRHSDYIELPETSSTVYKIHDSAQFNLVGLSKEKISRFVELMKMQNIDISVFGIEENNARCYWNWKYIRENHDLPNTKCMLIVACDLKLPLYLEENDMVIIGETILQVLDYISKK
ncbi:DegT/DnrJ/EryC1/StrS family aminotransferase [Desulfovibrio inopinatus]|uniref:DegT/DnrJ/EryC1/StrS family aminotransferase n=1 Tax=Desulfovibrio inopinatus TaxID=102109 RepID=UPI0003F9AE63|nr:aminotransferase class I/II-fold pyridoxal phosphate-dependent enzyme [Desulfovibrio inopinatus]